MWTCPRLRSKTPYAVRLQHSPLQDRLFLRSKPYPVRLRHPPPQGKHLIPRLRSLQRVYPCYPNYTWHLWQSRAADPLEALPPPQCCGLPQVQGVIQELFTPRPLAPSVVRLLAPDLLQSRLIVNDVFLRKTHGCVGASDLLRSHGVYKYVLPLHWPWECAPLYTWRENMNPL